MPIPATPEMTSKQMLQLVELTALTDASGNKAIDAPVDVQTNFTMSIYNTCWNVLKGEHYLQSWSIKPPKEERLRLREEQQTKGEAEVFGICPNIKADMASLMGQNIPLIVLAALYEEWSHNLLQALEDSEKSLWKNKKLQAHLNDQFRLVKTVADTFNNSGYNYLAIFDTCVTDVMDQHKNLFT